MNLSDITSLAGAHRRKMRVGRGRGSGKGKTCGRGHKGAGARAGGGSRRLTEGGQMALSRRVPKRGFNNANFRTEWSIVNVGRLQERFEDDAHVTGQALVEAGLIRNLKLPVKILAAGELSKKLRVDANKFSAAAAAKIAAAGGEAKSIG